MSKLIKLEIKNIFSKFDVRVTLLILTLLGFITGILNKVNSYSSCDGIFEWTMVLTLLISALGGLYISKDYTQNTIRNKIIVGHTRLSIYLSKQIAVTLIYLACSGLFMTSTILSNFMFVGTNINKEALLTGVIVSLFVIIALSTITTFISMSIKKETGGLIPLLVMFVMMMLSAWIPEFVKGKAVAIINDIVPTSQMILLNLEEVDSHSIRHILYSLLLSLFFFISGYNIFKNSDLN